jgi:hypothetical protein
LKTIRVIMVLTTMFLFVEASPQTASADSTCAPINGPHCYGQAVTDDDAIAGVRETINPACLWSPTNEFATDEAWLVGPPDHTQNNSPTWVEVGLMGYGGGQDWANGQSPGRYIFWADNRPAVTGSTGGFHLHWLEQTPSLPTTDVVIGKSQSFAQTYNVTATHGTTSYVVESENNYMDPNSDQYGSESTSNSANSDASFTALGYKKAGTWYDGMESVDHVYSDHNQVFKWIDKPNSFEAGMPC